MRTVQIVQRADDLTRAVESYTRLLGSPPTATHYLAVDGIDATTSRRRDAGVRLVEQRARAA